MRRKPSVFIPWVPGLPDIFPNSSTIPAGERLTTSTGPLRGSPGTSQLDLETNVNRRRGMGQRADGNPVSTSPGKGFHTLKGDPAGTFYNHPSPSGPLANQVNTMSSLARSHIVEQNVPDLQVKGLLELVRR